MNKKEIIDQIKRIAAENNNIAPGKQRFFNMTGIRESDWYPHLWLRWSDAIKEAGLQPNKLNASFPTDYLIMEYIKLIRELNHFPIVGEHRIKSKSDNNFPSHSAFSKLGSKQERLNKIIKYCENKSEFNDIVSICSMVKKTVREKPGAINTPNENKFGYVYLIKHGTRNEYKIGKTYNPIRREGELRLELPEKVQPIHYIKTDDPSGVETYWHSRFSHNRKEGEWFSLTSNDVHAFKRWKCIY